MEKGTYGYIKHYRKKLMISIIVLGLVIIFGVGLSIGLYHTTKTLIILLPILTSLPFAKQLVGLILCADFKPLSKEEHEKITTGISYGNDDSVIYDISISQYEGILFFPAVVVRDGRILFLYQGKWTKKIHSVDEMKKHLIKVFENEKHPYVIIVASNVNEFITRANQIKKPSEEFEQKDRNMKKRIFELGV